MKIQKKSLMVLFALLLSATLGLAQAASTPSSSADQTTTSTAKSKKAKAKAASTDATGEKTTAKGSKLDINTATKDELDALPGIGSTYSQKIIDGRPYNAKNDLVRKKIIPQSAYDGIKDQIIAHRAPKAAGSGSASAKKSAQ
jgi:DNA uptake protein ComE-like DNA-binding protein